MLKKRSFLGLILLLVLSMVLAACAPDRSGTTEKSSSENENDKKEKPEQLLIWANDADEQIKALEKITKNYTKKTGIKVKIKKVSMTEQTKKLALAGPAGNGPDLFFQPHDRIGDVVAQGLAKPIEMSDAEKSGYSKPSIQAVTYDGTIYGAPAVIETYALYYNKALVNKPPETMDELMSTAKALTDTSKDKYGFLIEPNFYYTFPFWKNYGGYIFGGEPGNYDTSDIGLNNEGSVKGASVYQELYNKGLMPQKLTVDILNGLFAEGKVGMVVSGPWNIPTYSEALGDKLATAPLPKMNGEPAHSFVGVKSWMVSYYSEYPKFATDLALYMTNDKSGEIYNKIAGELPPRPAVLKQIDAPLYEGFVKQIESGIPMPNVPEMSQVWEPMNAAHQFIAKGQDVQAVLDEAVKKIKQQIAASGK